MKNIKNITMVCDCLFLSAMSALGQSPITNVSSSSSMVNLDKNAGIDRYILSTIHNNVNWLRGRASGGDTNSNRNVSVGYSPEKIAASLEWYRAFRKTHGHQIDEGDIEQVLVYATVLSSVDGKREEALSIYDSLLKSKLPVHAKRQLQAETGSLLIQLATYSEGDVRNEYLSRARKIADELLWVQDVWFGKAVAILAHIYMLEGDYDKVLKLFDDYKPQLKEIDKALGIQATAENNLYKLSPLAEVRYVVGVTMYEKAKNLIQQDGYESDILKLLVGDRTAHLTGAFVHFMNVAIRYPESEWAADSAQRAAAISYVLDKRYGRRVRFQSGASEVSSWGTTVGY